jgi:hypothetical protein
MARQLNTHVHAVQRDAAGSVVNSEQFPAGTWRADLPAWAREAITNPDVWTGEDDEPTEPAPQQEAAGQTEPPPQGGDEPPSGGVPVPPMGGPAGSTEAWADYARAHDIQVEDGAKRGDIIEQLRAAGVPVEPQHD